MGVSDLLNSRVPQEEEEELPYFCPPHRISVTHFALTALTWVPLNALHCESGPTAHIGPIGL